MAAGCTAGLVNAGGDMRVFGQRHEPVFVRGPAGTLTPIELVNAALAVSDTVSGQRPPEHLGYYVRGATPTPAADQHAGSSEPAGANERGGNHNSGPSAHGSGSSNARDSGPSAHGSGRREPPAASSAVPAPFAAKYAAVTADKAVIADALAKCVVLCAPAVTAHALRAFGATQLHTPASIATR